MSNKAKLEYIWFDGKYPSQSMRCKTKIENNFSGKLEDCPVWYFDGTATKKAEANTPQYFLKPVAIYPDSARKNGFMVMSEILNSDGSPDKVSTGKENQ